MKKQIIVCIIFIIVTVAAFIGGAYSGIYIFVSMRSTTMFQDAVVETSILMHIANAIDKGENKEARQSLKIHIDSGVVTIDSLADILDVKEQDVACKILSLIAEHRAEYPVKDQQLGHEYETVISDILDKWRSCRD